MENINIVYTDIKYLESYNEAIDSVAREKKFLASSKGFPISASRRLVESIIKNNLSQFFALDPDNQVIGWCDIIPKTGEYFYHTGTLGMGIIKSYRHKGIGSRLIIETLRHSKKIKLEKIELQVFEKNTPAVNFFLKYGFKIEGKLLKAKK
ncbi:MAG: N-acetyltransferase family protein, partial [Promethearchaeota archaeon]